MLENAMYHTSIEFMFYTNNVATGLVYTYFIQKTNVGRFKIRKDVQVFLPNNYDTTKFDVILKILFQRKFLLAK